MSDDQGDGGSVRIVDSGQEYKVSVRKHHIEKYRKMLDTIRGEDQG